MVKRKKLFNTPEAYFKAAKKSYANGKKEKAFHFFEEYLARTITKYGPQSIEAAKAYDKVATYYMISDQEAHQGRTYLEKAHAIAEAIEPPNSLFMGTLYKNLFVLEEASGKDDLAIEYALKALPILEQYDTKEALKDCAQIYSDLGGLYEEKENDQKVIEAAQKCFDLRLKAFGIGDPETLESHQYLCYLYDKFNAYKEEEEQLKKFLQIQEEAQKTLHPIKVPPKGIPKKDEKYVSIAEDYLERKEFLANISLSYYLLGNNYIKQRRFLDAEKNLKKSLQIGKDATGESTLLIANTYHSLGDNALFQAQEKEAIQYLEKARIIKEKVCHYPIPSEEVMVAYEKLASTYEHIGNQAKSKEYIKKAKDMQAKLEKEDPFSSFFEVMSEIMDKIDLDEVYQEVIDEAHEEIEREGKKKQIFGPSKDHLIK